MKNRRRNDPFKDLPYSGEVTDGLFPGCEYTEEQKEWLAAIAQLQTKVRFPPWTMILDLAHSLGYRRPGFNELGRRNGE